MTKAKQRRTVHYHQGFADGYKGRPVMYVNPPKRFLYRYRYGRGANKPLRGYRRRVWVYRAYMKGRQDGKAAYRRHTRWVEFDRRITAGFIVMISAVITALTLVTLIQHSGV